MLSALPLWFDAAILAALSYSILQLVLIGRCLMATQSDVDALTAQVVKVALEVRTAHDVLVSELAEVKAQLAAAGVADKVDLTALAAAIQNVDDINPDAVAPEPVVEPVVEETVVVEPVVEDSPPAE